MSKQIRLLTAGAWLIVNAAFAQGIESYGKKPNPAVIHEIGPSIASIQVEYIDRTTSRGTGFFINQDGFLLTANHVVSAGKKQVKTITVLVAVPTMSVQGGGLAKGNVVGQTANVVSVDAVHDLAILLPTVNPFHNDWGAASMPGLERAIPVGFASFQTRTLHAGEGILVAGFPQGSYDLRTTDGQIASLELFHSQARSKSGYYLAKVPSALESSSGAPVFSASTRSVIGLYDAHLDIGKVSNMKNGSAYGISPVPAGSFKLDRQGTKLGSTAILPSSYLVTFMRERGISFSVLPIQSNLSMSRTHKAGAK